MEFFKNLVSRNNRQENLFKDYSAFHTDIHSHFIPGIDDGAKTLNDSMDLIRSMYNFGFRKLITTPHIMSDYYKNTPEIILSGLDKLRTEILKEGIPIELEAAAEYYCDFSFYEKIGKEKLLTFGNNYLLFEISYLNPPEILDDVIFKLQSNGYKPILAHPERYPFWIDQFDKYLTLKDKGVLLQLNINSLTGHYSPATKHLAEKMIEHRIIDFVGSDCHHSGHINLMKGALKSSFMSKLMNEERIMNKQL